MSSSAAAAAAAAKEEEEEKEKRERMPQISDSRGKFSDDGFFHVHIRSFTREPLFLVDW